jgi:cystathionine gamma-synthase
VTDANHIPTTPNPTPTADRVPNETAYVHAGVHPGAHGAVATGIEVSTTFTMAEPGVPGRYDYARAQNPTRDALENALQATENATSAQAWSSGLAAIDAVIRLTPMGRHIVIGNDAYGGTWRLLEKAWGRLGVRTVVVDTADDDALEAALDGAGLLLMETPTNPLLRISSIRRAAEAAHAAGARCAVDNTFATSWLQQPLDHGADISIHSATKYIGGHSDVVGGATMTRDEEIGRHLAFLQKAAGAVPGPFDCFLMLRGLRTLPLRVERAAQNAARLAAELAGDPRVHQVHYPGLPEHPGREINETQMRLPGAMLSIELADEATARAVATRTRVFSLAESLGAVESLIEHPASMTHASVSGSALEVPATLLRLSVGIENIDDLLRDIDQALG